MRRFTFLGALMLPLTLSGAITISGVVDRTKYASPVTLNVTADPAAVTTAATVDGVAIPVGANVNVSTFGFHELRAESRDGSGALLDSEYIRFIVRDSSRGTSEDGIPPHTPYRVVNDAPSAFADGQLKIVAPPAWPVGLPIPLAAVLRQGNGDGLRLNGAIALGGIPQTLLQLRRGWGSVLAPAAVSPGLLMLEASVNGLTHNPSITIEAAPVFNDVSGTITTNTVWPANSRMHVTGTLTIGAAATLTIGAGSIVTIAPATEIVVNGTLQVSGLEGQSVVFAPDAPGAFWGGIELPAATSQVIAQHAIFTGAGADPTWFDTNGGYTTHRREQALFLVAGSGAGTAVGAQLHLTDCYCFSLRGQQMNSKTNTWIDLQRVLMQRCTTSGELNGSKVTIDRSALIEFPSEDGTFVDGDNDAIYLTNGDLSITNTVIGFTKDDGVDSGGNGGDNPFTAAVDVTPFVSTNNWYEGTYHEGNSLSGTRNVSYTGCVFFNCGQGLEAGYSASATGDGPNALADGCLFIANMVGGRWGDNYGSGYQYNATFELRNSLLVNNIFHDVWSYDWNAWTYFDATALNSFGRAKFNVHGNRLSQLDPVHHPLNVAWNAATDGALLAPYMPVPNANVGVAITSYAPAQGDPALYPGAFTVRLSTFSAHTVTVDWAVRAKVDPAEEAEITLGSGALTFAPGETLKDINVPVVDPEIYGSIRVALFNPVHAEVTGGAWYFRPPTSPDPLLIPPGGDGWRYRQTRSEPPAAWKQLNFDDSSPVATEWLPATLPAGFGVAGVTFGTTVAAGSGSDRTKAFFFRKKFQIDDPAKVEGVMLRIRRDDAAVVWLNNEATPTVVSADGTFNPPYTYDATTLASGNVPAASNTNVYVTHTIPASKLVAGENILAIQVHQTSLSSSDLILDAELTANYAQPLQLNLGKANGEPVLWWFGVGDLLEDTVDFSSWTPVPGGLSPFTFTPSGPQRFFRLRR